MTSSTLTSKGQTTIPQAIREHLSIHPGDRLDYVVEDNGEVRLRPSVTDLHELRGMLSHVVGKPKTVEEMNAAIRRRKRGRV